MGTVRIKDHWGEQRIFERRALAAAVIIALLTLVLIGRLVVLQIVRYDHYAELSQGNRVRVEPLPAQRGLILDRTGAVLAENRPAFQLELVRERVPNVDATLKRLVEIGVLEADDVPETIKLVRSRRSFESVPIRLRLTDEEIARFAVHRFEFPGVDIATRLTRFYPHGEHAVHALGYVAAISENDVKRLEQEDQLSKYAGTTLIGKLGIEHSYEKELHGEDGSRQILVNAAGRSVQQGTLTEGLQEIRPVAGRDVLTSIDLPSQLVAEQALQGRRGAVVAIDPNNGDVVVMASTPGFDPNAFGRGLTRAEYAALRDNIDVPLLNRALRGEYPPGSTVKPVIALAGLAYGVTTPQHTKACGGYFRLPGSSHRFRDWRPAGHGVVAMETAIAQSCDVYFYDLSNNLGVDRLAAFLAHFGFGQLTGIDIANERKGILPTPAWKKARYQKNPSLGVWFPGETVIYGIGQGSFNVTPLQLAHMTATVASRGKSYQPRLVTAYREQSTGKVEPIPPKLLETVEAAPEHWKVAIDGMIKVMNGGTGSRSQVGAQFQIAGKTGTAQVFTVAQNERYNEAQLDERLHDHGLFVAFAPAENPRLAVAVIVENGKHGSTVAPIARRVLDQFILGRTTTPEIAPPVRNAEGRVAETPAAPGDE